MWLYHNPKVWSMRFERPSTNTPVTKFSITSVAKAMYREKTTSGTGRSNRLTSNNSSDSSESCDVLKFTVSTETPLGSLGLILILKFLVWGARCLPRHAWLLGARLRITVMTPAGCNAYNG